MVTVHSVCRCKCYLEMSDLSDETVKGSNKEPVLAVDAATNLYESCMNSDSIGKQRLLYDITKRSLEAAREEIEDALRKVALIEPGDGKVSVCRAREGLKLLTRVLESAYDYNEAIEELDDDEASEHDKRNLEGIIEQLTEGRAGDVKYIFQMNNADMLSDLVEYLQQTGRGAGWFWQELRRHVTGHLGTADDEEEENICNKIRQCVIDTLRAQGVGWEKAEATWEQELMHCIANDDDELRSLVYGLLKDAADAESARTEQAKALKADGGDADHGLDLACHEESDDTADTKQQKRKAPDTGTVLGTAEQARLRRVKQQQDKIEGK